MPISRAVAVAIMKYLWSHPKFYFPFTLMNQEYGDEDDDFNEIVEDDYANCIEDESYQTRELRENLQGIDQKTTKLLATGFLLNMDVLDSIDIIVLRKELADAKELYETAIIDIDFVGEGKVGTERETFERGYYRGIERAIDILSGKVNLNV